MNQHETTRFAHTIIERAIKAACSDIRDHGYGEWTRGADAPRVLKALEHWAELHARRGPVSTDRKPRDPEYAGEPLPFEPEPDKLAALAAEANTIAICRLCGDDLRLVDGVWIDRETNAATCPEGCPHRPDIVAPEPVDGARPTPTIVDNIGDYVCVHGTALDVHCCNCHSGFIFDLDHVCPPGPPHRLLTEPEREFLATQGIAANAVSDRGEPLRLHLAEDISDADAEEAGESKELIAAAMNAAVGAPVFHTAEHYEPCTARRMRSDGWYSCALIRDHVDDHVWEKDGGQ